jgi:hypothetical protein
MVLLRLIALLVVLGLVDLSDIIVINIHSERQSGLMLHVECVDAASHILCTDSEPVNFDFFRSSILDVAMCEKFPSLTHPLTVIQ